MKKTKYTLLILFSLFYFPIFSQSEFVVEINKINGAFTKTGPAIAGIIYIYPNDRTYDENTGTFIFPSSTINHSLYSINVANDSILNNPVIGNIWAFQFDNISNTLYGIEQDNTLNVKNFISINPITGTYNQIGNSLPNSVIYSGNFSTFNKTNHTYIFLAPINILYSIDATNGNVISNPNLVLASGESIVNFSFDNSTGILYGLLQDNNLQKYFLVTINPATGTNVRTGLGTTFAAGAGSSSIDEINQQYIYMYSSPTAGGYAITTLDLATGSVVYNALIQAFIAADNFFSLKYDNIQGKLYSIHWETNSTGIAEPNNQNGFINIFPNPIINKLNVRINSYETSEIILYDIASRKILQQKFTNSVSLNTEQLANGIYIYEVRNKDGSCKKGKVVKD